MQGSQQLSPTQPHTSPPGPHHLTTSQDEEHAAGPRCARPAGCGAPSSRGGQRREALRQRLRQSHRLHLRRLAVEKGLGRLSIPVWWVLISALSQHQQRGLGFEILQWCGAASRFLFPRSLFCLAILFAILLNWKDLDQRFSKSTWGTVS